MIANANPVQAQIAVEQSVVAACLSNPENLDVLAAIADPRDFENPFHRRMIEAMLEMRRDGRTPSAVALTAAFNDGEIESGLSVSDYLRKLMGAVISGHVAPFAASVETLVDQSRRRTLASIGSVLAAAAIGGQSVRDLTLDAMDGLSEIVAAYQRKSTAYTAEQAALAALEHALSDKPGYPTTGLADLDAMLGGWPMGQLTVIAGRPGMGKSAIATSTLLRTARAGHPCLMFSLEMQTEQLGARLLTDLAYTNSSPIAYQDVTQRRLDERQVQRLEEARQRLADLPITIEEQRGLSIADIVARSRKAAERASRSGHPLEVIFVDHMLLVRASQRYAGNRVREVAEISDGLATLAKELGIAVVALCQLNRGVEGRENKRPSLSDLRDSGSIEEDASAVILAYRQAYYLEREKTDNHTAELERQDTLERVRNDLELAVAKNRNGRIGIVNCFCDIGANAIRNGAYERGSR